MITKQTAMDIAKAYREIETAEAMLAEIVKAHKDHEAPEVRDASGRLRSGLQLSVPTSHSGHRLYDVPWSLIIPLLEAHIAMHKSRIRALSDKVRSELEDAR